MSLGENLKKYTALDCQFLNSNEEWTVGDIHTLSCTASNSFSIKQARIHFEDSKDQYSLHVLNTNQKNATQVDFKVASYKVETFSSQTLFIMSSSGEWFKTSNLSWSVRSTLKKDSKPHDLYGPYALDGFSALFYISILIGAFLLGSFLYQTFIFFKKQKLKKEMKAYQASQAPAQELYKAVRKWNKKDESIDLLYQALIRYLTRSFNEPFFSMKQHEVLKCLKKRCKKWPAYKKKQILVFFQEIFYLMKHKDILKIYKDKILLDINEWVGLVEEFHGRKG